jgi:hypothetical protein
MLDCESRYLDADVALVEDAGTVQLEELMQRDPRAAAAPMAAPGDALRRMHATTGPRYGKLTHVGGGSASEQRRTEDVVQDRALCHLNAIAARDPRIADAYQQIVAHVCELRDAITPRATYGLVHGELGPDHVLITATGEPVVIDFEGLAYFDVEWDHAWLQMRFGGTYKGLRPVELDPDRMRLYRYAQVLSLIEGPLRIADTDFPDRQWMRQLAEHNIGKALAAL